MQRKLIRLTVSAGLFLLAACGGSSTTGPSSGGNGGVSADIDGAHWTAVASTVTSSNGVVAIGSADASGVAIGMAFPDQGPGTYAISSQQVITNFSLSQSGGQSGVQSWSASAVQGSGSVVITSRTANHIVGTFSFSAPGFTGTPVPTTTKVVTNGKIDITY